MARMQQAVGADSSAPVEYDLHGIVGIRLVGAGAGDVAAVTAQLGPIQCELDREPDIVIRFVDRLPVPNMRYLGREEAGFTDDAFLVLRSKKARARVQIPVEQIGGRCEIVCESGLPAVPLLIPIVNVTALAKGVVPLHAAAFTHRGSGVLVTGWAKAGKTESLLGFMSHGAEYIGDEWVYVSADGRCLRGIPEPVRIWDWHLDDLPRYRALLSRRERAKLRGIRAAIRANRLRPGRSGQPRRASVLDRVMSLVEQQAWVLVDPARLFGPDSCPLEGSFDKLFLIVSHESPEVLVARTDPLDVARRMVFSLQHERLDLVSHYLMFCFAFPGRSNPVLQNAEAAQRTALERAFAGKETYVVSHPYPAPIPAVYEAMNSLI
jgi:hypothetical protein